jgi:hypothetical protein
MYSLLHDVIFLYYVFLFILSNQVIFLCIYLFLHLSVYLFGNAVREKGSVNNFMVAYPPYSEVKKWQRHGSCCRGHVWCTG